MKHFLLLCFSLVFLATGGKTLAQCLPGYTPTRINMTISGCAYAIDLCVKCPLLGQLPSSVYVMGFMQIPLMPPCNDTLTYEQKLQHITLYATNPDFYYTFLCPNQYGAPPCPDQSQPIEIRHWNCWKVEIIEYAGDTVQYQRACNYDSYCYEKISWCYDTKTGLYSRSKLEGPTQYGTPSCSKEAWEITIPPNVGDTSECFIIHNACR